MNIQHLDILLETRKHRVLMEASFPQEMQETFTNIENQSNPWGFRENRAQWIKDMDVPLMTDRPQPTSYGTWGVRVPLTIGAKR